MVSCFFQEDHGQLSPFFLPKALLYVLGMVILAGLIKARNTVGSGLKAASKLRQRRRRRKGEGENIRDLITIFRCAD